MNLLRDLVHSGKRVVAPCSIHLASEKASAIDGNQYVRCVALLNGVIYIPWPAKLGIAV